MLQKRSKTLTCLVCENFWVKTKFVHPTWPLDDNPDMTGNIPSEHRKHITIDFEPHTLPVMHIHLHTLRKWVRSPSIGFWVQVLPIQAIHVSPDLRLHQARASWEAQLELHDNCIDLKTGFTDKDRGT